MTYSNRGGSNFGGQNYGRRDFSERGSDRPAMFDAICAKCGANCQVPFKPNGRKEVFCSKCFETQGGGSRESSYGGDRQMFRATCDQCGASCQVPFKPTSGKPVLCSNCFAGKTEGRSNSGQSSYSRPARDNGADLEAINVKLDRILKLLSPSQPKEISKEITEKILEEIEIGTEKKLSTGKKKTKAVSKK